MNQGRLWAAAAGLLVLLVVNVQISRSEKLLANGRDLYLQLAPVDPRSIMQGDYMTLNFHLANALRNQLAETMASHEAQALVTVDARGVGQAIRVSDKSANAGTGELLLNYRRDGWRVHLVTDAFFFEEGRGEHFAQARFGHFRVDGNGRALLVGLLDEQLRPL